MRTAILLLPLAALACDPAVPPATPPAPEAEGPAPADEPSPDPEPEAEPAGGGMFCYGAKDPERLQCHPTAEGCESTHDLVPGGPCEATPNLWCFAFDPDGGGWCAADEAGCQELRTAGGRDDAGICKHRP
jgi:hypothetical protein